MENEFAKRSGTEGLVAQLEEVFVGETLFLAAEYLADSQGLDLTDILESGRALNISINRPVKNMNYEYEFIVCADEGVNELSPPALEYILQHGETELKPLTALDEREIEALSSMLMAEEEPDEDLLFLLSPAAPAHLREAVLCGKEYLTYYRCSQESLSVHKNSETNYYINGEKVISLGFASDDVSDLNMSEPVLMDMGMGLSVIEPEDIDAMREILYYLNVPGGIHSVEVTSEYLDDSRVVV